MGSGGSRPLISTPVPVPFSSLWPTVTQILHQRTWNHQRWQKLKQRKVKTDWVSLKDCGQDLNQGNHAVELSGPKWLYSCNKGSGTRGSSQMIVDKWSFEVFNIAMFWEAGLAILSCGFELWNAVHISHTRVCAIEMNDKLNPKHYYWLASARQIV